MAAQRGLNCSVLFNGVDLSRFLKTAAPDLSAELLDATTFQAPGGDKEFLVGFRDGKLSLEGFFSADNVNEDDIDDIFNSVIGGEAKQLVTVSPEGADEVGKRAFIMEADTTSYKVSSPAKDLIMSNAEMQSSSGLGLGFILHPITPVVTATGDNASLDNGAASGNGGAAQIHVIAFDGTTPELDSKVQHSDDDSTWVDLAEFTQATGVTSERLEVDGIGAGNAELVVTAAGMTGSPKTIPFAVAKGDSASIMAGKAREALAADADVTALFAVSGTGANIVLTRLTLAANDATLNIASDNDTSSGLIPAATSANTVAGSAGVTSQVETATIAGTITGTVYQYVRETHTLGGTDPEFTYTVSGGR